MARLHKYPQKLGTQDGVTTYIMNGKPFIRSASSLTEKRVKTDPAFKKTMEFSSLLGKASKISAPIYAQMKKEHPRKKASFRDITSWAYRLLKAGQTEEEVVERGKLEW